MNGKVAVALTLALLAVYPAARLATAQSPQAATSYLFVQSAKTVDYKDGVLTLYDMPRHTIFFSDRPNRVVGNMPTEKFVTRWATEKGPNGFATVPPNAAITVFQSDGPKTAIVELSTPRIEGNNLSYKVKVLQGAAFTQPAEGVLFIDDYTGWAQQAFAASTGN
jgi:hypothetical protein